MHWIVSLTKISTVYFYVQFSMVKFNIATDVGKMMRMGAAASAQAAA